MARQKIGWSVDHDAVDRGHFAFGSVSNTTARELIIDCNELDELSVQVTSGGTLTATITVLGSNSYRPKATDAQFTNVGATVAAGANAQRAGTWVSLTSRVTGIANPAGSGGDCLINVAVAAEPFVAHNFVKIVFTPASGTGPLDMFVSGKSSGQR